MTNAGGIAMRVAIHFLALLSIAILSASAVIVFCDTVGSGTGTIDAPLNLSLPGNWADAWTRAGDGGAIYVRAGRRYPSVGAFQQSLLANLPGNRTVMGID